jgi:hypothetical protein
MHLYPLHCLAPSYVYCVFKVIINATLLIRPLFIITMCVSSLTSMCVFGNEQITSDTTYQHYWQVLKTYSDTRTAHHKSRSYFSILLGEFLNSHWEVQIRLFWQVLITYSDIKTAHHKSSSYSSIFFSR